MDSSTPPMDERVKQVTLVEGFLHIDLRDGMRLTGPLKRPAHGAARSRLVETAPGSPWSAELNLDGLMAGPSA